jgi:hypothetical protein
MDLEQCPESYSNVRPIYEMVQDYREAIRQQTTIVFYVGCVISFRIQNSRFIHMLGACAAICR